MIQLRKWQEEALAQFKLNNSKAIVEATTGSGKTILGLKLIEENQDKRILVVVPTTQLMYQWKEEILKKVGSGIIISLLGDGNKDIPPMTPSVTISVVNSVRGVNWNHPAAKYDILICDEIHRYASPENAKIFQGNFNQKIGLTATLERSDGMEVILHKYIGPTVYTLNNEDAKNAGYVCDYDIECVKCAMTNPEKAEYTLFNNNVKKYMMVFNNSFKELQKNFKNGPRGTSYRSALEGMRSISKRKSFLTSVKSKHDVAINLCLKNNDKKIILFDEIQTSANDIYDDLNNRGMNPVIYHSGIKAKEKKEAIEKFLDGRSKILVTVKALDEGLDVEDVDIGIIVNGNSQKRQAIQRLGRLLRKKEGKVSKLYMLYVPETKDEDYVKKRIIAFGKSPRDILITNPLPIVNIENWAI
jgi:superfamily II DNA or RNA helicase